MRKVSVFLMVICLCSFSGLIRADESIPDFNIKLDATLAAQQQKQGVPPASSGQPDKINPPSPRPPTAKPVIQMVKVPSVTGKSKLVATNTLKKMGFKVRHTGKKIGKVRKQSLKANSMAKKGAAITLTIGK